MPNSGISPHKKWGKFRWTAEKEKGVGFRLCSHSPSFSVSRYEDRERRRGNRAGGCRRKGNALASRCAHQGIIVGDIHAGIGRCQGLVSTGTDALPWVAATRRKGGSVPLVECNRHPGRRRAAQGVQNGGIQGACGSVPGVLSQTALVLGATAQFPLPTRIRNRPHFLALPNTQQLGDLAIAVATVVPSQRDDVFGQAGLVLATLRRLALRRTMLSECLAGTALRDTQLLSDMLDAKTVTCGAQKFPRAASCKITLSSVRSDTARRRRAFSVSSSLKRLI